MKKLICLITSFLSISAATSSWLLSKSSNSNPIINNNQTQTAQTLIDSLNNQINYIKTKIKEIKEKIPSLEDSIRKEKQRKQDLETRQGNHSRAIREIETFEKIITETINSIEIPQNIRESKDDLYTRIVSILDFYKDWNKNVHDQNNPNNIDKLLERLSKLKKQLEQKQEEIKLKTEIKNVLERINSELPELIESTKKEINELDVSINESQEIIAKLEKGKKELESEAQANEDKIEDLEDKLTKTQRFIYDIANKIWEEKFKDNLLESESFAQISKEFEDEINKMLEKKVTLNVVNEQTNPVANTKDTNNTTPQKLKFKISDVLFEFDLGIVWPNRNKPAVYEGHSKNNCIEIGYFKNKGGNWQIERFDRNTQKVPSKLPRFIINLDDAFNGNKSSEISGIEKWNTSNVIDMWRTFAHTPNFNQDISDWDTSNVTLTQSMFWNAKKFNQNLNNWNMSKVTTSQFMFYGAVEFNGNVSNWDMSQVTNMKEMFFGANNFNQDLSSWIIDKAVNNSQYKDLLTGTKIENDQTKWPRAMRKENAEFNGNVSVSEAIVKNILQRVWNDNFANRQIPALRKYTDVFPDYASKVQSFLKNTHIKGLNLRLSEQQENERFPLLNNQPENRNKTFNVDLLFHNNWVKHTFKLKIGDIDETRSIAEYNRDQTECIVIGFDGSPRGFIQVKQMPTTVRKVPKLLPPQITRLQRMFYQNVNRSIENIDQWDTRNIDDITEVFKEAKNFNQNINSWNTSKVEHFKGAFEQAENFNQPLSNWNVANGHEFSKMFSKAIRFSQPLNNWRFSTTKTFKMDSMFSHTKARTAFNQDLDQWNVENLTSADRMFEESFFNGSVHTWKTNNLKNLDFMFFRAGGFNRRVNEWNVTNIQTFKYVFHKCSSFNQPLYKWDLTLAAGSGESTASFKNRVEGMLDGTFLVSRGRACWYPKGMVQHGVYHYFNTDECPPEPQD
ncbi:BspA family leucine-rich repeat surface protein [Mycoplasma cottewii]|uniref:BspA family leucine-rich repeat surface protein n=1 Tax=Mycoplasma cottewii TaxID=51364 RepID=A0ABY5U0R0_9MOLU|nr:BspA family leucine-rich repeat surface protein [Mycoplasma cottewii]UWD35391.1 BspA family leucine-rich repeat surface protein [Mycoplasma cottewii]